MHELDKTGLEAAREAVKAMDVVKQGEVEAAISAYLSTASAGVTEEQTQNALHNAKVLIRALSGPDDAIAQACLAEIEAALEASRVAPVSRKTWTCAARKQGTAGGNDPADCDWPVCGCDPYAVEVIAALQETGLFAPVSQKEAVPVAWRWLSPVTGWVFREEKPDGWPSEPLYASPAPAVEPVGIKASLDEIAEEARRYAGFYPEASDGRNTFIIFAEWIERRSALHHSPTPVSAPAGEPAIGGK